LPESDGAEPARFSAHIIGGQHASLTASSSLLLLVDVRNKIDSFSFVVTPRAAAHAYPPVVQISHRYLIGVVSHSLLFL
jgi:hypothetical protein